MRRDDEDVVVLYHGTAFPEGILDENFQEAESVFDGEDGFLETHGGVYLTDDIQVAARYAARAASALGSMRPGIVAVSVRPERCLLDEDALCALAADMAFGGSIPETEGEPDEIEEILSEEEAGIGAFARSIGLRDDDEMELVRAYLASMLEARAEDRVTDEYRDATVCLCRAIAKAPRGPSPMDGSGRHNWRVEDPSLVSPFSCVLIDLADNGLTIVGFEVLGDFPEAEDARSDLIDEMMDRAPEMRLAAQLAP